MTDPTESVPPPRPPRRVLVTGAAGQLGKATVCELARRGVSVTALSLAFDDELPADRMYAGDAADGAIVAQAMKDVEGVIHLAAIPHPSLGTPLAVFSRNVSATFNVLDQAGRSGVPKAVISSSINAWGVPLNPRHPWPLGWPIDEDEPFDHGDAYSLSKAVDELSAKTIHRRDGLDTVALRLPLTKSCEELRDYAFRARADPAAAAREGWSYLDQRDGVDALVQALLAATPSGAHTALVAAPDTLLNIDTADAVRQYTPNVPMRRKILGRGSLVDTSRARALFGFRATHPLGELDQSGDAA